MMDPWQKMSHITATTVWETSDLVINACCAHEDTSHIQYPKGLLEQILHDGADSLNVTGKSSEKRLQKTGLCD